MATYSTQDAYLGLNAEAVTTKTTLFLPLQDVSMVRSSGGQLVGGASALETDDGDASRADFGPANIITDGGTSYSDASSDIFTGSLPPASIPSNANITDMRFVMTLRREDGGTHAPLFVVSDYADFVWSTMTTDAVSGVTSAGIDVSLVPIAGASYSTQRRTWGGSSALTVPILRTGGQQFWIADAEDAARSTATYLTLAGVLVTYTVDSLPATIAPPLRQYPRSDGLATSSARRMWPPSRSYQRSIRRAGGYL